MPDLPCPLQVTFSLLFSSLPPYDFRFAQRTELCFALEEHIRETNIASSMQHCSNDITGPPRLCVLTYLSMCLTVDCPFLNRDEGERKIENFVHITFWKITGSDKCRLVHYVRNLSSAAGELWSGENAFVLENNLLAVIEGPFLSTSKKRSKNCVYVHLSVRGASSVELTCFGWSTYIVYHIHF